MIDEGSIDSKRDIVPFFENLFNLNRKSAGNFLIKYLKDCDENQIEAISDLILEYYTNKNKKLFFDMPYFSGTETELSLNAVCIGLNSKKERYGYNYRRDEAALKKAIVLADGLNNSDKNQLFKTIATDQIESPLQR